MVILNNALTVLLISAIVFSCLGDPIVVKDCGSHFGSITSVEISKCSKFPCVFKRNSTVTLTVHFNANTDIEYASNQVFASVQGHEYPFPMTDTNACNQMHCPIAPDYPVTYENDLFIFPFYQQFLSITVAHAIPAMSLIFAFTQSNPGVLPSPVPPFELHPPVDEDDIMEQYPGLFKTDAEIRLLQLAVTGGTPYLLHGCCNSTTSFKTYSWLKNKDGKWRKIVEFKGRKQAFQVDSCNVVSNCNFCSCYQQTRAYTALVQAGAKGPIMEYVLAPTLCRCLNVSK